MKARTLTFLLAAALLLTSGCSTLPPVAGKTASRASGPAAGGKLAEISAAVAANTDGDDSAFLLVPRADEAMLWRLALIDSAQQSIDAQYFIWKDDASGTLVMEHIYAAADRGVKVRLLVDDMFLSTGGAFSGVDEVLAAIDSHPNIELRLFNPGKYRNGIMGLAGNFGTTLKSYNRRMHNKLMVFDGHFALIGGRNIGDEYFGLHEPYNFLDLDVLMAGPVIAQTEEAFDDYWNAELAYPTASLHTPDEEDYQKVRRKNREYVEQKAELLAAFLPEQRDRSGRLASLATDMQPGWGAFLADEPVERGGREYRLYDMLDEMGSESAGEFLVSAPYLIPVGPFLEHVQEDVASGTRVELLTNSLASNDATAAHSHYRKYRRDLLATGAQLYEFRHQPSAQVRDYADTAPGGGGFVGLHFKASAVDGEQCFIGSLNLDPRAVELNTENGLWVESPALCGELREFMLTVFQPDNAWQVTVDDRDRLQWTSSAGTVDSQPAQGAGQRVGDFFFGILPLESQL